MSNVQEWQQLANKELSRREKTVDSLVQQTAEGIAIKPLYTEADLDNLEERYPQRVSLPQHLYLPTKTVNAYYRRHHRLVFRQHAAI